MEYAKHNDVVAHGPVQDHEGEAVDRELPIEAPHMRRTVGVPGNEAANFVDGLRERAGNYPAAFRTSPCCIGKIGVRLVSKQYGPFVHPRIAFNALLRACSGETVFASPRR